MNVRNERSRLLVQREERRLVSLVPQTPLLFWERGGRVLCWCVCVHTSKYVSKNQPLLLLRKVDLFSFPFYGLAVLTCGTCRRRRSCKDHHVPAGLTVFSTEACAFFVFRFILCVCFLSIRTPMVSDTLLNGLFWDM